MDIATMYDAWYAQFKIEPLHPLEKKLFRKIIKLLNVSPNNSVLDIGCGCGSFLSFLDEQHIKPIGIDISPYAINLAKKRIPHAQLLVGDASALPFEDDSFEFITCLGSLEHFLDQKKAVREISRVLKPSGRAVIMLPNLYFVGHIYLALKTGEPPDEAGQQFSESFSTYGGWKTLLEENGLTVISSDTWNYIVNSKKVHPITKHIYNLLCVPFIPKHLSYNFLFVCQKSSTTKKS